MLPDPGAGRQAVGFTRLARRIAAVDAREPLTVLAPIAVEPQLPRSLGGESDQVVVLGLPPEVGDDHDVIPRSAPVPAAERQDLPLIVDVVDMNILPAEPPGAA